MKLDLYVPNEERHRGKQRMHKPRCHGEFCNFYYRKVQSPDTKIIYQSFRRRQELTMQAWLSPSFDLIGQEREKRQEERERKYRYRRLQDHLMKSIHEDQQKEGVR